MGVSRISIRQNISCYLVSGKVLVTKEWQQLQYLISVPFLPVMGPKS
jgi:hypothetical protein